MSFFNELKRRNVFRVAIAYLALSWLLIQVVETLFPLFGLSEDLVRLVVILCTIGFPLVLVFSWVYELTPEGFKKDEDVDRSSSGAHQGGKKLDRAIIIVLALSLGYFAFDKFVLDPTRDAQIAETSVQKGRSEALVESYGESSIAVLPFINMSADAEQEYFSDGISEELLNLLAKIPKLRVISRSSSFTFKGKDIDIPTIAKQLSVAHILEGSVRKAGNKVRITAQLIEARSDTRDGHTVEELSRYEKAIELNPNYADAWMWLSNYYRYSWPRQPDKTFTTSRKAAQLDPLSVTALHSYIVALVSRNKLAEADIELAKLASISPVMHADLLGFRLMVGGNWASHLKGQLDSKLLDPENRANLEVLVYSEAFAKEGGN